MSNFRIYNQMLCPDLWDEYQHLNPQVRVNLLRMAYDFYEKTKFPAPIIDVYLMGSAANYNWTPESDADVHVIIDYSKLQMPEETANKAVKTAGSNWNLEHQVTVKGHKVEMNLQNANEVKPHVTGIYSLVKDQWVRKPSYQNLHLDKSLIQVKYNGMKKYIESSLQSGDRETMKKAKDYVDAFRQYGLDTRGELSIENIVYKILRAKGLIKALKDAITATYDKEMTVKEGDALSKDLKSKYFTIKFGDPRVAEGAGVILLGDEHFANIYKPAEGWAPSPEYEGKWVINRSQVALNSGFPVIDKYFDSPEDVLPLLDDWYEKKNKVNEKNPLIEDRIKWRREEEGEQFFTSEDGEYSIIPLYLGRQKPQKFEIKNNKTGEIEHALTLKDARDKADKMKDPNFVPKTKSYVAKGSIEQITKQLQDNYDYFIKQGNIEAADQVKKNAEDIGVNLVIKENDKFLTTSTGFYWWLSPDKKLYNIGATYHHTWAKDYVEKVFKQNMSVEQAVKFFFDHGWIRLGMDEYNNHLFIEFDYGNGRPPDRSTTKFIEDLGLEKGAEAVRNVVTGKVEKFGSIEEKLLDTLPTENVPYLVIGFTNGDNQTVSGVATTGYEGHGKLKDFPPKIDRNAVWWRYKSKDDTLYLAAAYSSEKTIREKYPIIKQYLDSKYHIIPKYVSTSIDRYLNYGHEVTESNAEDITIDGEAFKWTDAIGPFIIFKAPDGVHYIFSTVTSGWTVFLDGKSIDYTVKIDGDPKTHLDLETIGSYIPGFKSVQFRQSFTIHGRIWEIDGDAYVSCWNDDVTKVGIPNSFEMIKKVVYDMIGIRDQDNIFFADINDNFYPISIFSESNPNNANVVDIGTKIGKKASLRSKLPKIPIHQLSPEEKKKALAAMGAKPKVGNMPDWEKKALAGIDEDAEMIVVKGEDYNFDDSKCVGPFLILKNHYIFSNKNLEGFVVLDGKRIKVKPRYYETHASLASAIFNAINDILIGDLSSKKMIEGRTWVIDGKAYVSCWSKDVTKLGISDPFEKIKKVVAEQTGISDHNLIYFEDIENEFYPINTFSNENPNNAKLKAPSVDVGKKAERPIHDLPPEEKKKELAARGAKPKVGSIPDWERKQLAGVDEDYEHSLKAWWMDTNGDLFQLYKNDSRYGHFQWALNYWKSKGMEAEQPTYELIIRGWVRIMFNYYGDKELHFDHSRSKHPNEKMLGKIKDLGIELGASKIFDDTLDKEIGVLEITRKDISSRHPYPAEPKKLDMTPDFEKMTLGNLKAIKEKIAREWDYFRKHPEEYDKDRIEYLHREFKLYDNEIKRRLAYINNPLFEIFEPEIDEKNLYLGFINPETFKVAGQRADVIRQRSPDTKNSHGYFVKYYHIKDWHSEAIGWRFRKDLGTLYWWIELPSSAYRNEVEHWIEKNIGSKVKDNQIIKVDPYTSENPTFRQAHGLVEMGEGYGAGDPTTDPKHIPGERWRIKFDSSSHILKESKGVGGDSFPFASWESADDGILYGWRSSGAGEFGNTEGDGMYISKDRDLASFFGTPRQYKFVAPKKPLIVNEEPLYLLHEMDELFAPPDPKDSLWTRLNKLAAKKATEKFGNDWNKVQPEAGSILSKLAKKLGYDAFLISSGGDQWVVLFDPKIVDGKKYENVETLIEELVDESIENLAKSLTPLKESLFADNLYDDYSEIRDDVFDEYRAGQKYQTWRLVKAQDIINTWITFAKYKRVDEEKLWKIWDIIKENVIKIAINSGVKDGSDTQIFDVEDCDEVTDEMWERWFQFVSDRSGSEYVRNFGEVEGNARYSDSSRSLVSLLETGYSAKSPEELLMVIDGILNFVHGLGHMAKWFVEGGVSTLNKIADFDVKGIVVK